MNISRHVYPIVGIFTLLTAASLGSTRLKTHAAASSPLNVFVTNSAATPVPTSAQGTTAVTQSGGWNVGINNSAANPANVKFANSAANPLVTEDVNLAGRTPVDVSITFQMSDGDTGNTAVLYNVPVNKVLVIESIYGNFAVPDGQVNVNTHITSDAGSNHHEFPVQFTEAGSDGTDVLYDANAKTTLYVEPGAALFVSSKRSLPVGIGTVSVSISGYLENIPVSPA